MRLRSIIAVATMVGVALGAAGLASAQGVYRWVDKDGNVHYSQTPPREGQADAPAAEPKAEAPKAAPEVPAVLASLVPIPLGAPPTEPVAQARFLLDNRRWDGAATAEAARLLDAALKTDPKNAMALTQAARLAYFAGYRGGDRYDPKALYRAATLVERALAVDPKLPEAHVTQGLVFYSQKAYAKARHAALEAVEHHAGDAEAEILLASVANVENKWDEALARVQAALRTATTRSQQRRALQELTPGYRSRGEFGAADQTYAMVVTLDPDSPWWRINYANFLNTRHEYERALPLAKDALAIMDFPAGHEVLSKAAMGHADRLVRDKKDWAGAGDYYALAVEHDPQNADAHYGLAMSYRAKAGLTHDKALLDKAGAALQAALKIDPRHARARRGYDDLVRSGWKP